MRLADTTAWSWSRRKAYPELRSSFDEALVEGEIAICDMVKLELLHSARGADDFVELRDELDALPQVSITEPAWERAIWVYGRIAAKGGTAHRGIKHPDLLIAAAAELAGVPLLHYDGDYDEIQSVTDQPMSRLAPKGSLR